MLSSIINRTLWLLTFVAFAGSFASAPTHADAPPLKLLFLGDNGHHQPLRRFEQLAPVMAERGIQITYTGDVNDLTPTKLSQYAGVILYANIDKISDDQANALLDYVASGKGFVPLHCASYCFRNNDAIVALIGAQFQKHGTGVFRVKPADGVAHPIVNGYGGFESWDETYVHTKHNDKDRTVLEYRTDENGREPWTWVRTHGKGRVFYTAWGHDQRTWGNPGFVNLLERGIRWAVGGDEAVAAVPAFADVPAMTPRRADLKPFQYEEAQIAFYPPGGPRKGNGDWNKKQLPVAPEESQKHIVTPAGFGAHLFAAEPQIGKPISMAWDEQGRLWIAETVDYPNELQPEGEGRDRIRICEDTDGDGRADKFTVFAEKLSIPTSMIFARGGVIVHQAPHTLFLKDTNGDDVADERHVLFTGWSTGDTHAGPSNLNYGLDNWIYGQVGYAGFKGEIAGEKQDFRTGFYRLAVAPQAKTASAADLAVNKFEFLRNTNNNSWGVSVSEEGILFGSTANGNPSVYMPIANRYYEAVRGWSSSVLGSIAESNKFDPITEKVRQVDWHGGFTAAAGHALYTARNYPKEYWNRAAFVTEPTGHLVATFILQKEGADFHSRNSWNLVASDDEWTAPIMAEVGPDGNVWMIDWYNYIVQHNPTPVGYKTGKGNAYETDLRDKQHGRIYRLVHERSPQTKPMTLKGASPEKLVATLSNDNLFWRRHAQRLLVERGQRDVVPALLQMVKISEVDEIGLNVGAIHALWTLHGLGVLDGSNSDVTAVAVAALKHRSAGVRRNALLVLPRTLASVRDVLTSDTLNDADGQVRLAALLTLADLPPNAEAGSAVFAALANESLARDRWLTDAATSAAAKHDVSYLRATAASKQDVSATQQKVLAIVAEHYARGVPRETIAATIQSFANALPLNAVTFFEGAARGWPNGQAATLTDDTENSLVDLLKKLPVSGRGALVTFANRIGSKQLEKYTTEISASFFAKIQDEKAPNKERIDAATSFVEFRRLDADAPRELLQLITPRTPSDLASGIVEAVARSEADGTGTILAERLAEMTPAVRTAGIRTLISRTEWTTALLDLLAKGAVQLGELTLDQKQALSSHPNKALAKRAQTLLAKGGGLPNPDRQKVLDELMPLTKISADANAGKEVFKKQCQKCHVHSGEGTKIGPDLTGMAVHPKRELLTHIIDPSRSVEGNYRVYTVVTDDGRVRNGLLASESKTAVELIDSEAKRHAIQRSEIEQMVVSPKSLMPEGFEKQVTKDDIANLLEFLTRRGKYLPLPLDKVATIVTTKGMFHSEAADAERLIFPDWSPKTFEGVPFTLVDPQGDRQPNAVMLNGPNGPISPKMPKAVLLPCNSPAKAIHFLSGVGGWSYPASTKGTVSMIVRLRYADGSTEDHPLKNGEHFADYIRRVDVPGSKFAFALRGQQIRYLAVFPAKAEVVKEIELVKGPDTTSPVVMAVTIESPVAGHP